MKKILSLLSLLFIVVLIGSTNTNIVNAAATVKSIEIKTLPSKRAYNVGDGYSTQGMIVEATMSDGSKETIDNANIKSFSGVTITEGRAFTMAGMKTVEISYSGAKASFTIAVFDPAKEYYITYNTNGGDKLDKTKIDGSTEKSKLPTPKKKGAKFLGWYDGNGKKYSHYEQGIGLNIEFTAKWAYTISFNANGGTGTMKSITVDEDTELPKNKFKKSGYKFVGWSTKKSPDVLSFYLVGDSASYIVQDKGITLYAIWTKGGSYKITYASVKNAQVRDAIKKYTAGKTTYLPDAYYSGKDEQMFVGYEITLNGKKLLGTHMEIPPYISGDIKLTPIFTSQWG